MLNDQSFRIGGLVRVDSVNYPGLVACTVFTQGCNLRCPYCHNPSLVVPQTMSHNGADSSDFEEFSVEKVFSYIEKRRSLLDAVVVSGGEPCIQSGLLDFLSHVKDMGLSTKLDTNGCFPDVLERSIGEGLVDYVAMDIKTSLQNYSKVGCHDASCVMKSVGLVMAKAPDYEFRMTCERSVVSPDDVRDVAIWLDGAKRFHIQKFNPKVTLDASLSGTDQYSYDELESFAKVLGAHIGKVSIR